MVQLFYLNQAITGLSQVVNQRQLDRVINRLRHVPVMSDRWKNDQGLSLYTTE